MAAGGEAGGGRRGARRGRGDGPHYGSVPGAPDGAAGRPAAGLGRLMTSGPIRSKDCLAKTTWAALSLRGHVTSHTADILG